MEGYNSDIAELDRLDEENRLNDLDFADDSSLSDLEERVRELQSFINPNPSINVAFDEGHDEINDHGVESMSRPISSRYAVNLSSSIEKDTLKDIVQPGKSHSLESEVSRLTKEVLTKTAEIQAQKLHINHLALQVKALADSEADHRMQCEAAKLAHATAEQDKMLLEVC